MLNQFLKYIRSVSTSQSKPFEFIQSLMVQLCNITGYPNAVLERFNSSGTDEFQVFTTIINYKIHGGTPIQLPTVLKQEVIASDNCLELNDVALHRKSKDLISGIETKRFLGVPLFDAINQPIGIICLLNYKSVQQTTLVKETLLIAALKIAQIMEYENQQLAKIEYADYQNIIHNSYDIIYKTNLDHRITYISPGLKELTGFYPRQFIGKHIFKITTIDDNEKARFYNEIKEYERTLNLEVKFSRTDRGFWWGSVSAFVVKDNDGNPIEIEGLVRDITKLKLNEQRLQTLSNATFEGIIVHNNGIAIDSNQRFSELLDYPPDEIIGKNVLEFTAPESHEAIIYHIKNKLETPYEVIGLRKDGSRFHAEIRGHQLSYLGEAARITVVRDITAHKTAQSELIDSEKQYKELLDLAPDAFFHGDAKGNFLGMNNKAEILTGYDKEELLKMNMKNLFSDSTLNKTPLRYDLLKEGKTIISEREILRKDKSRLIIEMNSKQMPDETFISFFRDISFRKIAEQALIESEERYKMAFQTSPDAVNINDVEGVYVDVNEGFTKLTGYTKEEVLSIPSLEVKIWANPEDRDKVVEELKKNGQIHNYEADFVCKDGKVLTGLMSASIIMLNGIAHVLSITRNITDRKKLQNELIEAKRRAEESDRLKTDFLNNMSHEIRTPLNAIMGFSRLLGEPDITGNVRQKYLDIINTSGNQLLTIISDIIDISQLETGQIKLRFTVVDLNKIIDNLMTQFTEQSNSELQFIPHKGLSDKKAMIQTDQIRIVQLLTNLLVNARKFTSKGTIEFGYTLSEKKNLKFFVKDTGIGISKEHHKHIFERFRQAEGIGLSIKSGTGLGLAICNALIELFKGEIWVESELGKGAHFYFTIPYDPCENNNSITFIEESLTTLPDHLNILIAEDEEANFIYLEELFNTFNGRLIRAKNGLEAVEQIKENPAIDIVLMDLKMPVLNGYEAAKKIKKIKPDIPIIAITAYAMKSEYKKAIAAGCSECLSKPIAKELLFNCIVDFIVNDIQ